jgi:hypothetical protein
MGISGGRFSAFLIRSTPMPFASGSEASHSTRRIEGAALIGRNGASLGRLDGDARYSTMVGGEVRTLGRCSGSRAATLSNCVNAGLEEGRLKRFSCPRLRRR